MESMQMTGNFAQRFNPHESAVRFKVFATATLLFATGCTWINGSITRTEYASANACAAGTTAASGYTSGTGTAADPYIICTLAQWNKLAATSGDWSKAFKLGADIDMSTMTAVTYTKIGSVGTPFSGSLDGSSYKIKNFTASATGMNLALFDVISNSTIQNLGIENFTLGSNQNMATIALTAQGTTGTLKNISLGSVVFNANGGSFPIVAGLVSQVTASNFTVQNIQASSIRINLTALVSQANYAGLLGECLKCSFQNVTLTSLVMNEAGSFFDGVSNFGGIIGQVNQQVDASLVTISSLDLTGSWVGVGGFAANINSNAAGPFTSTIDRFTISVSGTWSTDFGGVVKQVGTSLMPFSNLNVTKANVTVNVSSSSYAGGIVYWSRNGSLSITESTVKGALLHGDWNGTGGLATFVGVAGSTDTFNDNYVTVSTIRINNGRSGIGGLIKAQLAGTLNMNRNYVASNIVGNTADTGRGCVAWTYVGVLVSADNYYDSTVCTLGKAQQSGGTAGVTGQNTASMQPSSAFTNWNNGLWIFSLGAYPKLSWE